MSKPLTEAETRVLRTYCEEETHAAAAVKLGISTQTVKNHLGNVYKKIGRRKAHSALYALTKEAGYDPLGHIE